MLILIEHENDTQVMSHAGPITLMDITNPMWRRRRVPLSCPSE
jgi:hypothetical protein